MLRGLGVLSRISWTRSPRKLPSLRLFFRERSRSKAFAPRKGMMKKSSKTPKDSQGHEGIFFSIPGAHPPDPWLKITLCTKICTSRVERWAASFAQKISPEVHPKGTLDPELLAFGILHAAHLNLFMPVATRRIQLKSKDPQRWRHSGSTPSEFSTFPPTLFSQNLLVASATLQLFYFQESNSLFAVHQLPQGFLELSSSLLFVNRVCFFVASTHTHTRTHAHTHISPNKTR